MEGLVDVARQVYIFHKKNIKNMKKKQKKTRKKTGFFSACFKQNLKKTVLYPSLLTMEGLMDVAREVYIFHKKKHQKYEKNKKKRFFFGLF